MVLVLTLLNQVNLHTVLVKALGIQHSKVRCEASLLQNLHHGRVALIHDDEIQRISVIHV
jgi:hypothetical protein